MGLIRLSRRTFSNSTNERKHTRTHLIIRGKALTWLFHITHPTPTRQTNLTRRASGETSRKASKSDEQKIRAVPVEWDTNFGPMEGPGSGHGDRRWQGSGFVWELNKGNLCGLGSEGKRNMRGAEANVEAFNRRIINSAFLFQCLCDGYSQGR